MIDAKNVMSKLKNDLSRPDHLRNINIKCFKKDRSIDIWIDNKNIFVNEKGFEYNNYQFKASDIKGVLNQVKKIIDKEFYNSSKLWYSTKQK